jgi:hypothetical protein
MTRMMDAVLLLLFLTLAGGFYEVYAHVSDARHHKPVHYSTGPQDPEGTH